MYLFSVLACLVYNKRPLPVAYSFGTVVGNVLSRTTDYGQAPISCIVKLVFLCQYIAKSNEVVDGQDEMFSR